VYVELGGEINDNTDGLITGRRCVKNVPNGRKRRKIGEEEDEDGGD
jgi:hypothetical protein